MIGAFNTIYTSLQGFLSRDFWTALFAPVALFAAIHTAIATQFGLKIDFADLASDASTFAKTLGLVILGLVVVGYLLQPFMPFFRGLLDGSLLPQFLYDRLLASRMQGILKQRGELKSSFDVRAAVRGFASELKDPRAAFRKAYDDAQRLGSAANEAATRRAQDEVESIEDLLVRNVLPTQDKLAEARSAVLAALAVNSPSLQAPLSVRTDEAVNRLQDCGEKAVKQAESDYRNQYQRLRLAQALADPRATALGDARFVAERYAADVYSVDFDFLWPRLVLALRADAKDDPCNSAIDQGQARRDFAVLSFFLTCSAPLFWLPFMLVRGGQGWLFLVIGATAPVALDFFFRLAVEAQIALAEVVKTTIDRHRFLVLKMLRQPLPGSRDEERQLWVRIRNAEQNAALAYLNYAPAEVQR